jgi:flavin-binding protein dodecin
MNDPVSKPIERTGSSTSSIIDALDQAIRRANKTLETSTASRSMKRAATSTKEWISHGR